MKKNKIAKKYAKMYSKVMSKYYGKDKKEYYQLFYDKYNNFMNSEDYVKFLEKYKNKMFLEKIYVAITTYFVSTELNYSFDEAKEIYYKMARPIWKRLSKIVNFIDYLPCGFHIISRTLYKMNNLYGDSIKYSLLKLEKDKYEYVITKCPYIEIFEHYGIRKYCKVMCDSDLGVMGGVHRHVQYTRFSDMSEGETCHDVMAKVKKKKKD